MYPVSQKYLTKLFSAGAKQRRIRGYVDSIPFTENDIVAESLSIVDKCLNSDDINLGGVFIGKQELTFLPSFGQNVPRGTWKDRCISMSIGLHIDEDEWEDIPIKPFYIREANHSKKGISITAYDALDKFDKNLNLTTTTGTVYDFAALACQACGVQLGMNQSEMEDLPNGTEILGIYSQNDMSTWRDFISWIAVTVGGFATIDRLGRLVFRVWHSEPDITIDIHHRDISGSWSDFETYYTGLSIVNMDTGIVQYYSVSPDTGLTMKLGSNPFMQYGTDETKDRQRMAILNALQDFVYTPYSSLSFIDPALDLADVVEYTDGLAGSSSICCIHKMSLSYRKGIKLTGFGKNPALFGAQSKTDKNISGLLAKQNENEVITYTFTNAQIIELEEDVETSVALIKFATNNPKTIKIFHELDIEAELASGEDVMECEIHYYLNNELISYKPVTTWDNDGLHLINPMYFLQNLEAGTRYEWEVKIIMKNGSGIIARDNAHAFIEGQGLVAVDKWAGELEASDEMNISILDSYTYSFSETVEADLEEVKFITASDIMNVEVIDAYAVSFEDDANIIQRHNVYTRITEDGDYSRITEDDDTRLTEGDIGDA